MKSTTNYKPYCIYLNIIPDCPDKSSREDVQKARIKSAEKAKKDFITAIKDYTKEKEIKVAKEQLEEYGTIIEIEEKALDKVIEAFIKLDIVSTIDANYSKPVEVSEEKKDTNSKDKMKKYMK